MTSRQPILIYSASPIAPPPTPPGPSADDIRKVISDYEARQAKKAAAGTAAGGDSKGKEADGKEDKSAKDAKDGNKASSSPSRIPSSTPASPPAAATPAAAPATHRKFALHRQIWEMRRQEMKRKEMSSKAKEVGRGLPQVPRGNF